ncbi:c-type cytochrome [Glacieibacterium frigidum]|uniref:Cytochrome c family protein n=1 Tax=Glacieibacterium frigidum TaxID=2593303 RepID=A0A552U9X2_9SPHN|nr:cytochrome c family protein [Glacieibacterium frigidum]TRW15008.1 cytochrome c family protein [Glacieibacterium frigidum]
MTKRFNIGFAVAALCFAAPALAALPQAKGPIPKGVAANGAKVFVQCKTCHVTTEGVNRIGPSLHAVVGRKAGTVPKYTYSAANKNSGLIWTEAELFTYLENPRKVVPGTKMSFAGLKKPQDRADLIAWLKTQ